MASFGRITRAETISTMLPELNSILSVLELVANRCQPVFRHDSKVVKQNPGGESGEVEEEWQQKEEEMEPKDKSRRCRQLFSP